VIPPVIHTAPQSVILNGKLHLIEAGAPRYSADESRRERYDTVSQDRTSRAEKVLVAVLTFCLGGFLLYVFLINPVLDLLFPRLPKADVQADAQREELARWFVDSPASAGASSATVLPDAPLQPLDSRCVVFSPNTDHTTDPQYKHFGGGFNEVIGWVKGHSDLLYPRSDQDDFKLAEYVVEIVPSGTIVTDNPNLTIVTKELSPGFIGPDREISRRPAQDLTQSWTVFLYRKDSHKCIGVQKIRDASGDPREWLQKMHLTTGQFNPSPAVK